MRPWRQRGARAMRFAICLILICSSFVAVRGAEEAISPKIAAEKLAHSAQLVKDFDIRFTWKTQSKLKGVTEVVDGKKIHRWLPFEGDLPKEVGRVSRQVLADDGKFRTEVFDIESGKLKYALVSDTKDAMKLEPRTKVALVGDFTNEMVHEGCHYSQFFRNAFGILTFAELFSERGNLRHIDDPQSPSSYVIETAPTATGRAIGTGWKLWLDPQNGYLPTRIEEYGGDMSRLKARTVLSGFVKAVDEIKLPTKATVSSFDFTPGSKTIGQIWQVSKYLIDARSMRFNFSPDPKLFDLAVPVDYKIHM